jgi:hypothetical protein
VIWLAITLVISTHVYAECHQHDEKTKDGLVGVENRWVKALNSGDQKALACILAPEFKDQGVYGDSRDRGKVIADLPKREDFGQHLKDLDPLLFGDTGVVRGVNHLTKPDGKPLIDVRFTDVFVYRDGHWQAVSAQETLVRPPEQKK